MSGTTRRALLTTGLGIGAAIAARKPAQGGRTPPTSTATGALPWSGMRYGANDSHFDALNSQLDGRLQVRRFYEGGWPSAPGAKERADHARGVVPWVSFSGPTAAAVAAGRHDATLASYFAASTQPKMVTFLHEADNGKATAADYRAAQSRIWNLKERHCPAPRAVLVGPCLMGWAFTKMTGAGYFRDWMVPGQMDFVGSDPYRFWRPPHSPDLTSVTPPDPKTGTLGRKRSMQFLLGDLPRWAADNGTPIAIGEYAAHPDPANPGDRPAWLQETDAYLRASNCIAACYFHGPWGQSGPWWLDRFHTFTPTEGGSARAGGPRDPSSVTAFAALIR